MASKYMKRPTYTETTGADITTTTRQAPSGFTSFLSALTDNSENLQRQKEEKEKADFYIKLREAGYSKDQASKKVNDNYKGNWLNRVMGKAQAFEAPEDEPTDIEETRAKTKYYNEGGSRRTVIDKMTPNQLQKRIEYLQLYGESKDPEVQAEIEDLNTALRALSRKQTAQYVAKPKDNPTVQVEGVDGAQPKYLSEEERQQQNGKSGGYKVGMTFERNGKIYRVINADNPFDPEIEEVG